MGGRHEGRRSTDRDKDKRPRRPGPTPAQEAAAGGSGRIPPELLGDRGLAGPGGRGTRAALLGQLQRAAGNDRVQRLLATHGLSRQADVGGAGGGAATGAIVDDAAADLAPGQMRRTPFLAALRAEVEGALASADPLAQADARVHFPPAFADLQNQDAAGLERSLRENLPGVEGSDARRYLAAAGVAVRAQLGGGAAGDGGPAAGGVVGRMLAAVTGLASALFKARDGATTPGDAKVVRRGLGAGQALDSDVRAPLETAYGQDFSGVRVHTDSGAAALSDRMGARAFTVGRDIAFAPGEYQPGSLVGTALIAHELAHVGQQGAGGGGGASVAALEDDADRAAVGAVVSQWTGQVGGPQIEGVLPRLRAGLRLQRCVGGGGTQIRPAGPAGPAGPAAAGGGQACATLTPDQWRAAVVAARALGGAQRAQAMTQLAQQAVCELGITVRTAGTSHPDEVHPDDYAQVPVLNFDARLNDKARWQGAHGGQRTPVGDNVGYNFHVGDRKYAVIGPSSLNENTPLATREVAQHELSLVAVEQGGRSNDDLELLAWTDDFRGYFHQYLALRLDQRPTWTPLIGYYEKAAPDVRQQALRRLVEYYTTPPAGADADKVRRQIKRWLSRRTGRLITDLSAALPGGP